MNTVIGLFAQWKDAKAAIVHLEAKGYDESAMGLLAGPEAIKEELRATHGERDLEASQEDSLAPAGAVGGLAVGELIGFLASATVVAIPGVGQGLAAGAILAAGIGGGAVIGTITGALIGMGANEARAHVLAADVERGNTLLTLETASPAAAVDAAEVMRQSKALSVEIIA
jgi:hypothetical protein